MTKLKNVKKNTSFMDNITDWEYLMISYTPERNEERAVCLIAQRDPNVGFGSSEHVKIVNAFVGDDADKIWTDLLRPLTLEQRHKTAELQGGTIKSLLAGYSPATNVIVMAAGVTVTNLKQYADVPSLLYAYGNDSARSLWSTLNTIKTTSEELESSTEV